MIVISIGSDAQVFSQTSSVRARLVSQADLFESLHVVVVSKNIKRGTNKVSEGGLYLYPLCSKYKPILFIKALYTMLKLVSGLKKGCNGEKCYISSQDPFEVGFIAFLISKISKIKLQLQLHTDCFNILYIRHSVSNLIRFNISRIILPYADSIRVVSSKIKSSLVDFNPKLRDKISILPVFTDTTLIQSGVISTDLRKKFPEFKKIILIVARLESEKNIELSIHAFQKALRFNPDLGLVIAGSGSKEMWLKEYANYLGVSDRVKFIGWQSDVSSLYKTSDLLLVTSLYEGYGLNMVESVACGTPVVATDVGVARDIGAIIVPYDAGQVARKVVETINQNKIVELPQKFILKKENYLELFKRSFK
jgi:glycosyltransferase involved in cell wall biosynthesis